MTIELNSYAIENATEIKLQIAKSLMKAIDRARYEYENGPKDEEARDQLEDVLDMCQEKVDYLVALSIQWGHLS